MRLSAILALSLAGCPSPSEEPAWAVDPIWLEPTEGGVYGFQTWELFGDRWEPGYETRHYLCAVVVRLDGTPTSPCADCDHAWAVQTRLVETDCPEDTIDVGRFLTLGAVGLGPLPSALEPDAPHPGQTSAAWADYGSGWEAYGMGWPAALDAGEEVPGDGTWDGDTPFQLRPTLLWDLSE